MVLTIDAGNTNTAIGLFDSPAPPVCHWRLSSRTHRTSDEFALHLRELLDIAGIESSRIECSAVCSVVPTLTAPILQGVTDVTGKAPLLVSARADLPVTIGTDNPYELGGDLIANAVGGYARARAACIVVDFGTALTFTVVDSSRCIRGAAIAPGLSTAVHGLFNRTSALPMVELERPASFVGRNTTAALRSGIMNGYAGLVDHMVTGIRAELAEDAIVMMTGGESGSIAELATAEAQITPWLTLEGLYHLAVGTRFQDS